MTFGLAAPLLFAAHLLSLLVAVGAFLALARERDRGPAARALGALGFLALAAGEAYQGAGFGGGSLPVPEWIRSAGYLLLLLAAIPRPRAAVPAVAPLPGGALLPALLALGAAVATALRRRRERGGMWLALGLLLLAASEAALGYPAVWAEGAAHSLRVAGFVAVSVFVVALTRHSIRFRFLVGFAGVLVAVVLLVSSAVRQVIDRNLREGAENRVAAQVDEVSRDLLTRAQEGARRVTALARGLAPEFERGRLPRSTAPNLLDFFIDLDFILLLDARGEPLNTAGLSSTETLLVVDRSPVVRVALNQELPSSSIDRIGLRGLVAIVGAAPVEAGGNVVGVAVAGIEVDDNLLDEVLPPGVPAAAFSGLADPRPVGSTFPGRRGRLLSPRVLRPLQERALSSDAPVTAEVTIRGSRYFVAIGAMRRDGGEPVGILMVAEPATVLAATQRQVDQVLFLVMLGVVVLAFVLSTLTARRITRPVVALTDAARRVQAGELEARAEVRGEDEVADLADAFNRMTQSVSMMTGELRDAAEEQMRLRGRLETVLNSMGDGLIAVDDQGRVVTYNPSAEVIVGRPPDRALGRSLRRVLKGHDAEGSPLVQGGAIRAGAAFVQRVDGGLVPVAISSAPLRNRQGDEVGRVYVLRDMTREHQVERMKTEFLSNVSHELRTPLTPIIGYSEIMSRRDIPPNRAKEFAASILDGARRLQRIVAMLVDFSAMEGGRLSLNVENVELSPVVERLVDVWRDRTGKHRFVTDLPDDVPDARVDPILLSRVLDELLDNAVKYSPKGGRVSVALTSENSKERPMLRLDVTDEGIGIAPGDLDDIFQDFQQVDASDTRPFGGLGLGLAFVKRVVEAHGGTINATSEPGQGSTFSFTVPAAHRDGESA
jgi:two-component system phosphate regulon sensor histidine kinase PhoR